MTKATTCGLCSESIEDGTQYYDIDSGEYILCDECFNNLILEDVAILFDIDVSDILDMHNVVKKTKDDKPAPEPPIPGQIKLMDDGSLQELTAEAIA